MKIAVYGSGSLGTIMGAYLSKAYGKDQVDLIDIDQQHVNDLNEKGAHVVGSVDFTSPVTAKTPKELKLQDYDLVLLLTKQNYNNEVLGKVKTILKSDGILLSLQNGVPEVKIIKQIDSGKLVAGSVEFGGTLLNNVESELTTAPSLLETSAFQIGELDGQITPRIKKVQEVLSNIGGVKISDNLLGTKWSKLLVNAAFSGLSAACNATYGEVINQDIGLESALHIVDEGLRAGIAAGVEFANIGGVDMKYFAIRPGKDKKKQLVALKQGIQHSVNLKASMLQDLEKGRKTEINEINGLISLTGKNNGIPTPFNDLVVEIVTQAQTTGDLPKFNDTMQKFSELSKD